MASTSTAVLSPLLLLGLLAIASSRTVNEVTADFPDTGLQTGALTSILSPILCDPNEMRLHFFTERNESDRQGIIISPDKASVLSAGWKANAGVRVITPGCGENIESQAIQDTKNAYLETGEYNIIVVDWSKTYPALVCAACVKQTGHHLGQFFATLVATGFGVPVPLDNISLLGHSLGAHVSGFAAKNIQETLNTTVPLIIAADPADPLFRTQRCENRLCKTDAQSVVVLHSSVLSSMMYGNKNLLFGKGPNQPTCNVMDVSCSFTKSVEYFAESISNPKLFCCEYCTSPENAFKGNCDSNYTVFLGDGESFISAKNGTYYCYRSNSPPSTSE